MTISPKVKIISGVTLTGAGAYVFFKHSIGNPDKKKQLIFGIAGGMMIVSGIIMGKKGIAQAKSLKEQAKINDSNNPAKDIVSEVEEENIAIKNKNISNNNAKSSRPASNFSANGSGDSFEQIKSSMSSVDIIKPPIQSREKQKGGILGVATKRENKSHVNGVKVVGKIPAEEIEKNAKRKQNILNSITAKEKEHKAFIKKNGWHAGLPIRNEISVLKAQLYYC